MDDSYRTQYSGYSQVQLEALFSTEGWKGLSFSQKMDACQEVENRYAAAYNVQPCIVTHAKMDGASYGWQNGSTICLNTYLVRDGQFRTQFTDQDGNVQEIKTEALAPGWNTLDTVYHEGTHGIQESTGTMPSTYISPDMDMDLYRIQGIEKEAYAAGQSHTLNALADYEKESGKLDAGRNEYIASVGNDSFQAALADAARNYNDPNIEQTLQNVINDRENNITRENASESYRAISSLCDAYDVHPSIDEENSEKLNNDNAQAENTQQDAGAGQIVGGADQSTDGMEQSSEGVGRQPAQDASNVPDDGFSPDENTAGSTPAAGYASGEALADGFEPEISGGYAEASADGFETGVSGGYEEASDGFGEESSDEYGEAFDGYGDESGGYDGGADFSDSDGMSSDE